MAKSFLVSVDLNKNELQNAKVQNLGTAPGSPATGQIYYDTGDNELYVYNGSGWVSLQSTGDITAVTAGTAISGGGTSGDVTVNFAPSELSSATVASDDKVVIADTSDSDNPKTVTVSSIAALASGDITSVVAGTNLNGGGTSGDVTLNLDASPSLTSITLSAASPLVFEGATADAHETTFAITDPTADRTITFQNATGTVAHLDSDITGNAATATALATARAINGVDFDGTAAITVTAAAGTLDYSRYIALSIFVNSIVLILIKSESSWSKNKYWNYLSIFAMVQHHKWSLTELEDMLPYEKQIYQELLAQWVKEENERIEEMNKKRGA